MKIAEGVTEELKCTCQMEWVQRCNNIHNRAEEIVLHEMIYSYGYAIGKRYLKHGIVSCFYRYLCSRKADVRLTLQKNIYNIL